MHRNAPLSETGRLRLARCVVDERWPLRRAAERFQVAPTTARRWAQRYRQHGAAGMADRSSRPHSCPRRLPRRVERRILGLRVRERVGPVRIAARLGLPASTVHRVLVRYQAPRLAALDRATGTSVRRYERARPGELVHVDIKKLGRIPDGGGHRVHGRTSTTPRGRGLGYTYLHSAVDDHSRLAYVEALGDERKHTTVAFWQRARAFFATCGITVERVLTDNGPAYRSRLWQHTLRDQGISPKYTRPYRPQTNGKVERFHRTLTTEWAYTRPYSSDHERQTALPAWLHTYNHHRAHTALGGHPPASRAPNLSGQNS